MSRLWAYYAPQSETIVIDSPDADHWLLAHELTHHLQARAGVPFDERQAWDAARHWVRTCRNPDGVATMIAETEDTLDLAVADAGIRSAHSAPAAVDPVTAWARSELAYRKSAQGTPGRT